LKIHEIQQRILDLPKQPFAVQESYPDDLHALVAAELGDTWQQIGRELNIPATVHLRWNTLKGPYQADLLPDHYAFGPERPHALCLTDRKNLFSLPAFKEGYIEVQDAGSQAIAPFLQTEPGQRVVDACAGAGGKTLHLAALMENKGKIIALDVYGFKLEELRRRARRASAFNVEAKEINKTNLNRLRGSADRLLLDVPCSGLGVLKRNPDAKWRLNRDSILQVQKLQLEILENYAEILKSGGKLVYATCSILPSENQNQVEHFLSKHPNFELEEECHLTPGHTDGFYMARLRKK
jgi:16S rRNA (cytosine967-C5)-methyltransferase